MIIYHNPNCSKSRQALQICRDKGVDLEVVEYLKNPPSRETLQSILDGLDGDLEAMSRTNDLKRDGKQATIELLAKEPKYLQRPILVDGERVSVARTPEAVQAMIDGL